MDLLEYQGKQLFARHGVPVPSGAPATTVDEAVAAADEIGYPCVVKAQVLIGGRGKAGGIKVATDRTEAEEHAKAILGMDIRGHTVHEVWIEAASDIASEYYASPACTWTRCSASRTSTRAGWRSRRASTPTSCGPSGRC
jgi:succinyl-CoA synthetase beta subunit